MGITRGTVIATLTTSLLLAGIVPASAALTEPDITKPVVSSTGLTAGELLRRQPTFTPAFTDDTGVVMVEILVDGVSNRRHSIPGGAPRQLHAWLADVPDGSEVDLTVRAYDAARNFGELTTRVRADSVAPEADFSPGTETVLSGGVTTIVATGTSADTASIVLREAGVEKGRVTAAPWELRWDTPDRGSFGSVTLVVADRAGNETHYDRGYQLDTAGPRIEASTNWIRHVVGAGRNTMGVVVDDPEDVARIEWWVDGRLRGTGAGISHDFGRVSRTVPVQVRAYDAVGNVTTLNRQVRVDATGPAVSWVAPASGALLRGPSISSAVRATDSAGVSRANLNGWEAALGSVNRRSVRLGAGRATLTWTVYDGLQNTTTLRRTVTVDNTRPAVKLSRAPRNKAKVKGTVKVAVAASDRNGIARVELLINGKVVARDYRSAYRFSVNTRKYGKKIKVQVRAYDKAGWVTTTAVRTWSR